MQQWFGLTSDHAFEMFGFSHVTMLAVFVLGFLLIVVYAPALRKGTKAHQWVRWILFIFLFLSEASYQFWALHHGLASSAEHLPLHLCGIASLFGMISLLTYHKKLIQMNVFIGIIPALMALITPEIPHGYEHYRYWKFFVHHMAIPWTSLFLLLTMRFSINLKVMLETYMYLVVYAVAIGVFNRRFETNYLYLSHPPQAAPFLNYLAFGAGYQINLALLTLTVFLLILVFYNGIVKMRRR
ncbi:TIGR02206 family membrane protein [Halobacillus campisalis]|uniref:TIGR02206 family membrane protein n=1 Tax=Halobacillus campisalis TaxID=435909 RepID=A0ABW2JZT6_9BACI|nr:TIGR02206 family membrane protein [Halobacillus campisalis]